MKKNRKLIIGLMMLVLAFAATAVHAQDPLPSWNDGPAKQAIIELVQATTTPGSPDFVPPAKRIATFDNDGTLWPSHPMYTQLAFVLKQALESTPFFWMWKETWGT